MKYGYCLPEAQAAAFLADADTFVDAELIAEGRDPTPVATRERRALHDVVRDWLFDAKGRGAKSGLPRLPPDLSLLDWP